MSNSQIPPVVTEYAPGYKEADPAEKEQIITSALTEKQVAETPSAPKPEVEGELQNEEPKTEEDSQFASKFAALSRKEKAIRERESQIEARMKEIEERSSRLEQEYEEKYGKYKSLPDRLKNQPLDVLAEEGVDFDTLMKMVLENDGKPTTEMQIQQLRSEMESKYVKELENLKQELAEKEKSQEEQRYQEAIEDYKYELNEFIDSNAETYELIKFNNASDLVYQVVEEHFNENGRMLSNEEACQHVENYLLEEAKKHLEVNKIKQLLKPETAPAQPPSKQETVARTLSNAEAATVPTSGSQYLSDEESKREAAKMIRWDD